MKRNIILLLVAILGWAIGPAQVAAQEEGNVIKFFSEDATMEDNPKKENYNITIYSPDGQWKVQLNYYAKSMFGTFGNEDFRLDTTGKNYNYARNPKNDMVFYSFTDMKVSVTDEGTLWRVKADCTTNNKQHFDIEAVIAAPQPKETLSDDLGYARIVPNTFYGTYEIHAENDNYKLAYGIADTQLEGTFYRADMLLPELTDKKTGQTISVMTATAVHTRNGERLDMVIDIVSEDLVQYHLTLFNGPHDIEVTSEKTIVLDGCVVQDLTAMYGCYQFGGQSSLYAVAIAVAPEALESGRTEWGMDDIVMPYTVIMGALGDEKEDIFDMKVKMEREGDIITLHAEALCMSGTLYHITMAVDLNGYKPEVKETINIDFGHIYMLDYSQGLGIIGIGASKMGKYQMRFYLNAYNLDGDFTNKDFFLEGCDIMVINEDSYIFHDATYMTGHMERGDNGRILITIDMIGIDEVCYHATMYLDDLECLHDGDYVVDMEAGVDMVAELEGTDGNMSDFVVQFQTPADKLYDKQGNLTGRGFVFSFPIKQQGLRIGGQYGYSEGNVEPDMHHFYEHGCEVRLAPVAGTLSLEPVNVISFNTGKGYYDTYIYKVQFEFVGQNAALYRGQGSNYLICIDQDLGLVTLDEDLYDSIAQQLAQQHMKIKKVLKGGRIIVEADDKAYDLGGRALPKVK